MLSIQYALNIGFGFQAIFCSFQFAFLSSFAGYVCVYQSFSVIHWMLNVSDTWTFEGKILTAVLIWLFGISTVFFCYVFGIFTCLIKHILLFFFKLCVLCIVRRRSLLICEPLLSTFRSFKEIIHLMCILLIKVEIKINFGTVLFIVIKTSRGEQGFIWIPKNLYP